MPMETRFPSFTVAAGLELVPPTVMILTHHPVMGAATLGAVLLAWIFQARMVVRAEELRDQRMLDYAQTTTSMGGDPAPVISALRRWPPDPEAEPEPARSDDDDRPWVHLPPSSW